MKAKTFSIPLQKKGGGAFKSGIFDYKAIREKAPENPFGIKPDKPAPEQTCLPL